MFEPLRLRVDGPAPGSHNMAVDEGLLDGVATGGTPPTLRFYGWDPPCLSLGYFQPLDVVDIDACRRHGVDVVRRPTAGRAILHHLELTYSVAVPLNWFGTDQGVVATYAVLSRILVEGLRDAGYPVTSEPEAKDHRQERSPACFDRPAQHEVLLDGRKVVGSAQVRRGGALLQHGSILYRPQVEETLRLLRLSPAARRELGESMSAGVGGLERNQPANRAALVEAIAGAFQAAADVGGPLIPEKTTRTR